MSDVHIAGTGIWFPEEVITNDEIVSSFKNPWRLLLALHYLDTQYAE